MKQTEARAMFPQHKLVFADGSVTVYHQGDTKRLHPVAEIHTLAAPGAHAFVAMSPGAKPARFAVVRSYVNEAMILKALRVEKGLDAKAEISLKDRTNAVAKVDASDFDTCLKIVAQHFEGSIETDLMKYVTTQARKAFGYEEKRRGKKITGFGWNKAIQELHGRGQQTIAIAQTVAKDLIHKADKPAAAKTAVNPKRLPRVKGQNDLALISDAITGKGKAPRKPKLPAHVETLKDVTDANKKSRAKIDPAKWSIADEKIYEGVMQDLQHLTLRINDINAARLAGLSIEAYDKKQKAKK